MQAYFAPESIDGFRWDAVEQPVTVTRFRRIAVLPTCLVIRLMFTVWTLAYPSSAALIETVLIPAN